MIVALIIGVVAWVVLSVRVGLEEHHFQDVSTFKTSNAYLAIDGVDGRIAYVSNHNPLEFQMAEVKDLQNIKTDLR